MALHEVERAELGELLSGAQQPVRKVKRAQMLLAAESGVSDRKIARTAGVGISTVYRTRQRFVEGNLSWALNEQPRRGAVRKLPGREEACLGVRVSIRMNREPIRLVT